MRGQRDLHHQQVIGHEEPGRHERRHEPAERETSEQEQDSNDVEYVIDVEAVARPLVPADARQRPVEAVAEPVHREHPDRAQHGRRRTGSDPVADAGDGHRDAGQRRQVVRVDERGHPAGNPYEQALLGGGEDAGMDPLSFAMCSHWGSLPRNAKMDPLEAQ